MFRTVIFYLLTVTSILLVASSIAQEQMKDKAMLNEVEVSPLTTLGDEYHNGIKLLQNRFRIDYMVEEITMVFFREFGSAPVVLVRPDGSKIFQSDADDKQITWFDSTSYDMIKIINPTPGPWQAVGQILPESRVMVVSELQLNVQPLPELLFSGEILKLSATLTNGGKTIDNALFRDAVSLKMVFESTNNPDFENFASATQTVATFTDNGLSMDERPLDGVFTGQFNLDVAGGEWRPVFSIETPLASREERNQEIVLQRNPIVFSTLLDDDIEEQGYHHLMIDANRELVDISSLLVDGNVRFPNGDEKSFSITEASDSERLYKIINAEYGIHRVKITAYGKTVNGRDFILDVPEYSFLVEEPFLEQAAIETEEVAPDLEDTLLIEEIAQIPEEEVEPESNLVLWLIIGSNLLLLLGGGAFLFILLRSPRGDKVDIQTSETLAVEKKSLLSTIIDKIKFKKAKEQTDKADEPSTTPASAES